MLDRNGKREQVRDALTNVMQRPIGVTVRDRPQRRAAVRSARCRCRSASTTAAPPQQSRNRRSNSVLNRGSGGPAPPPPPREPDPQAAPVQRVTPELVEKHPLDAAAGEGA
jgi:hypothetical protein